MFIYLFNTGPRTKLGYKETQQSTKTLKLSGLAGFLLPEETQRKSVTLDNFCSNFYSNFKAAIKVTTKLL